MRVPWAPVARIGLGAFWVHEGLFKYSAHFGRADILLVADSARANSRVPGYFAVMADNVLREWPGLFGVVMPLMETLLGVALILGIRPQLVGLASLLTLLTYWSSDQLIAQYPVMAALSAVVIAWPVAAARLSCPDLWDAWRRRHRQEAATLDG